MRRAAAAFCLVLAVFPLFAQTTPTATPAPTATPSPSATPAPGGALSSAKPYSDSEFPGWALKLRRFEIIAVGAFPVAYLFSGLGYDYVYYFSNGMPSANIPWPAGSGTSAWTNTDNHDKLQKKNYTLIAVAAGVSLLLATVDWALGLGQ
jgi:hypothetical protein